MFRQHLFLFLFLSFSSVQSIEATTWEVSMCVNDPSTDSLALISLYNATNGANWTNTWDLEQPMDTWYGVTLNEERCVICLDLDGDSNCSDVSVLGGNNLVGTIPMDLGNLTNLMNLYLTKNQLSGSIPPEIGNLTNLLHLYFFDNQLSGSIPSELGNLSNLEILHLSNNQLSGAIPATVGSLSNLITLFLSSNQLSGVIPSELGNLNNLVQLSFNNNQLSGNIPPELSNMSNLTQLKLNLNQLSGNIPTELGNMPSLLRLQLVSNQLSGSIPPELGNISNLEVLSLQGNQLSGYLPSELANLSHLQKIWLSDNQLEGCFPIEFSMFCDINHNFTGNSNLYNNGDFAGFCEDPINLCCLSIGIAEQNGPTCDAIGNILLEFVNIPDGVYTIDYEGGAFEDIEVIDGQATIYFTEEGTYNNLSITIDDCSSTENPSVTILPINTNILSLNEINHPETCDAIGSVDFNVEGYIGELYTLDYSWRDGEPSGGPDFRAISNIPAGSHFIAVIGDCHFFTDTLFVTVAPFCTDVWPGDANNSGQVDFEDALSIILKNEKTGPVRPNASETWEAQLAADWEDLSPDGVDAKHADGNGDGVVNPLEDLGAVAQNYLKTIPDSPNPPDQLFLLQDYVLVAERSDIQQLDGTTTVTFDLKLKNNTAEILEVAGLGFSTTYHNGANPRLESAESGLGIENDNLIAFSHMSDSHRIDGAIGRTDTQNVIIPAFEDLLITKFIIDEDIVTLDVEDPANNSISINFKEILIVNTKGDQFHLGGSTASFHAGQEEDEPPFLEPLSIALSATHSINCPEAATASISPAGGVPPYQYLWEDGQTTAIVSQLDPGTYYATVSDANQEEIAGLIMIDGTANCSLPLALENLNFQATPQTNHILLKWTLNHQINTERLDIERSIDGYNFNTIARKTTNEQTHPTTEFEDYDIQPKQTYYYRLNMLVQGQSEYSTVVEVTAPSISSPSFHFFPNPVTNKLTIANKQVLSKPTEIVVFNAFGQKVQQSVFYQPLSLFILDFEAFSSGLYFISVQTDGEAFGFKVWKE